ncbi:hypothetical protein PENTCL1PPCAC_6202 [Pristionchus entomophagus]|uniref:Uncharacterized protein n=1 Tax=Pristionchus entomophagus TaxID=358040 RepID=A0AAV5SL04_9BILA|nr:hypothetical protein PENTCL1PPCAC_6202 [Pristionchus entomophagus]
MPAGDDIPLTGYQTSEYYRHEGCVRNENRNVNSEVRDVRACAEAMEVDRQSLDIELLCGDDEDSSSNGAATAAAKIAKTMLKTDYPKLKGLIEGLKKHTDNPDNSSDCYFPILQEDILKMYRTVNDLYEALCIVVRGLVTR